MANDIQNSNELFSHQHGLSFHEAIDSSAKIWENHLRQEKYNGNAEQAGILLRYFCAGIEYAYQELLKRQKLKNIHLPSVDFANFPDNLPIAYFKTYNTIVVSTNFLQLFENHDPEQILERIDFLSEVEFKGKIREFWFMTGVEEFVHSVDPDIKNNDAEQSDIESAIGRGTIIYHAQKHEYKALGWQLKAAQDQKFSEYSINTTRDLLDKVIKHRAFSGNDK